MKGWKKKEREGIAPKKNKPSGAGGGMFWALFLGPDPGGVQGHLPFLAGGDTPRAFSLLLSKWDQSLRPG